MRTSGHIAALVYFQFYILHQLSGLAYGLLRPLTVAENSENGYFDTEKLIIEMQKIFFFGGGGYAHKFSYIL
jgi:hypothetical protein